MIPAPSRERQRLNDAAVELVELIAEGREVVEKRPRGHQPLCRCEGCKAYWKRYTAHVAARHEHESVCLDALRAWQGTLEEPVAVGATWDQDEPKKGRA